MGDAKRRKRQQHRSDWPRSESYRRGRRFTPAQGEHLQINFIPFKLACPPRPTMMWSCTETPGGAATSMIALVIWMSACDGEGSYFGDKTLRMNCTSGATLDIIEPLALLTPTIN